MGSCFSISSSSVVHHPPTAKVISVNGQLREYPTPISVSRVIQTEKNSAENHPDCFLCNSNLLYYDEHIPALELDHQILNTDDIYFVLPTSKLQRQLTASDMAALAVKATLALQNLKPKPKPKKGRVSPDLHLLLNSQSDTPSKIKSPSSSLKQNNKQKLRRLASSRAKLAVRSFKLRLTTIYEATAIV